MLTPDLMLKNLFLLLLLPSKLLLTYTCTVYV